MSRRSAKTINLIRDTLAFLREEAPHFVLASQEDADYFRNAKSEKNAKCKMLNAKSVGAAPEENAKCKMLNAKFVGAAPEENAKCKMLNAKFVGAAPPRPEVSIEQRNEPTQGGQGGTPDAFSIQHFAFSIDKGTPDAFSIQHLAFSISSDISSAFRRAFPQFPLIDAIPDDAIAIKIANRWKTKNKAAPISVLSLNEPPEQKALLEQIAIALDVCFGSARVIQAESIEKEKQWEAFLSVSDLKLVVACDYTLWQLNGLMKYYKENPSNGVRTVGTSPLFLLPDLSLYLKDPQLKRSLWKALCQKLSS